MKIGIQLYSLRNEMADDFEGVFKNVADMGYDGVELAGLYGRDAKTIKNLCNELGILPFSAHVLHTELMENPDLLETYAQIGCKYMVIPFLAEEYRPGNEKFKEFLEAARILGNRAKELGMKLCYHNHGFELVESDGEYGLDIIYKEVPAGVMGTEFDTCWIEYCGANPSEFIRKYADRTEIIHIKDYVVLEADGKRQPEFCSVGDGILALDDVIKASKEADAKWLIVEQDEPTPGKTPAECVKKSIEYLRKMI